MFSTCFSVYADFQSEWYQHWIREFQLGPRIHRKLWEVAIICETLKSQGALRSPLRGVEFGCGNGFLAKSLEAYGPTILATDLFGPSWIGTHGGGAGLNAKNVDMNWIDGASGHTAVNVEAYDFSYSACSMDHCGSVWLTKRFLLNQMNVLTLGGVAVHTAEYTISRGLPREGSTSWMDCSDVVDMQSLAESCGYEMAPINWNIGSHAQDHQIDIPPYEGESHLKVEVSGGRWGTCIAFALRKTKPGVYWIPVEEDIAREQIAQRSHSQT